MQRAFHHRMLTKLTLYRRMPGEYNEDNEWVPGKIKKSYVWGVIKAGNKFSQFEEGIAKHAEDGGKRFSDYRSLYITDKFPIYTDDIIRFKGKYYLVLQHSDEEVYGFNSWIIEKSEDWKP